ncbi:MAG: gluconate kinase [Caulobacter sp.]|nr:gluconate kinase [Caulobacter sp.]
MTEEEREAEVAAFFEARAEKVIETNIARVYLEGERAWKVKRPVSLGYLDYASVELRHWALDRELSFNRAAAPDIYRAVRRVTREADGSLALEGAGEVVEHVLEMRRFDDTAVLAMQPWAVDGALAESLGREVARSHAEAPRRPDAGGRSALEYTIRSNANLLTKLAPRLGQAEVSELIAATDAALERMTPLLDARKAAGYGRRCHADLHLGNILLEDGRPILFDCIEFNDVLAEIDVLYDLAFLIMDLDFRRRRDAGVRVLAAYLDEAARLFPEDLWAGLEAMPLMLSVRAGVRCHVQAHSHDMEAAKAYLAAAIEHLKPHGAGLVAVGGLSGSGKSTFARLVAPGLGASPGAVVLRTDEIRKRMWGVGPLDHLPPAAYERAFGRTVYERMFHEASLALAAGRWVVMDAVFLDPAERTRAAEVAARTGVPFEGVWLQTDAALMRERVDARTGDASDADAAVLETQLTRDPGDITWALTEAGADFDDEAGRLVSRLMERDG